MKIETCHCSGRYVPTSKSPDECLTCFYESLNGRPPYEDPLRREGHLLKFTGYDKGMPTPA